MLGRERTREKERKEGTSPDPAHSPAGALILTPASLTPPEEPCTLVPSEPCCLRNGLRVIVSAFHRILPAKKLPFLSPRR